MCDLGEIWILIVPLSGFALIGAIWGLSAWLDRQEACREDDSDL